MTEEIAVKLSKIAVNHGIIASDDYELYVYSYQTMIERTVSWGSVLLLSIVFGKMPYTLVFITFYGFMRMFTGGWHASSFGRCFSISIGSYVVFSLLANRLVERVPSWIMLVIIIASGLASLLLGPIAHPNKPMGRKALEKCYYISCWVTVMEIIASIVFYKAALTLYLAYALFSFLSTGVSLAIAHISFIYGE